MKTIRFGLIGCGLMAREFASAAARWCHLTGDIPKPEIVGIAKKFADLGLKIYSTAKTGVGLRAAGIEVETIGDFNDCSAVLDVLEPCRRGQGSEHHLW